MINPEKIEGFLNRPRDPLTWIKHLPEKEIDQFLDEKYVTFKTRPFFHQKVYTALGIQLERMLVLLQPGLGKTKIFLDLLSYYMGLDCHSALIVVPRKSTLISWEREFKIHSDLPYNIGLKNQIDLVDYGTLQSAFSYRENKETHLDLDKLNQFHYDIAIFDESHHLKNGKSLRFKIIEQLTQRIPYIFGGTGTAITTHPIDLWGQFYIVDKGATFTKNFWFFRECFYYPELKKRKFGKEYTEWIFNKSSKPKLDEILDSACLRYSVTECADLPEKTRVVIECEETSEMRTHDPRRKLAKKELVDVSNIFMRCRTLASGLLHDVDKELGRDKWEVFKNGKIEALLELLEEIDNEPVVIFYEFTKSGEIVYKELNKLYPDQVAWIHGDCSFKQISKEINDFMDGKKSIMLSNTKSGGTAMNFQRSRYLIYYELPDNPKDFVQSEARVYRTGQLRNVVIYFLLTKKSIEWKIYDRLKEGRSFLAEIMKAPELIME